MKKLLLVLPLLAVLAATGCSPAVNTTNMSAEERFTYAKSLYDERSFDLAIPEFEAIMLQYAGSPFTDDAQFYLSMSRFQRKEYLLAAFEFSKLIKNTPASTFVPESQYMLAECYFQLAPHSSLDQRYSRKAIEEFQAFIDIFPTDQRVAEAEKKIRELYEKLAEKDYNSAVIYEKMEYTLAALQYFQNVTETYHDTRFAPLAAYHRITILAGKGRNEEAVKEAKAFLAKYGTDENAAEVSSLLASLEKTVSSIE